MAPCWDLRVTPSPHISLREGEALPRLAATSGQSCLPQGLSLPICERKPRLKPSIKALPPASTTRS